MSNCESILKLSVEEMGSGGGGEVIPWWYNYYYYYAGGGGDGLVAAVVLLIIIIIIVSSIIIYYFNNNIKKKKLKLKIKNTVTVNDDDYYQFSFHHEEEDDAKFAEHLQVQEALFASIPLNNHNHLQHEVVVCNICLENHENWNMFTNSTYCPHSFCYDCIIKHTTTIIQRNHKSSITCPDFNCHSPLDPTVLRFIIPTHLMIKWDQLLCESTILPNHKLYCPFSNCSALLVHDDLSITQTDCPVCHRSICALCRVPWHSDFTCKEFRKLNTSKNNKGDNLTKALAKKKKWKKCPNCNFFVEKSEGCLHITCRCNFEFCYRCGTKWTTNHGGCKPRFPFLRP